MQSLRPGAGHPAGKRVAPPTAAEVCPDVVSTYCAHAEAIYPAYGYAQGLDAINLQY